MRLLSLLFLALLLLPAGLARGQAALPEPDPETLLHLKTRAEVFAQSLARGKVMETRPDMDPSLRRALTDEALSLLFSDVQRRNGRLQSAQAGTVRLERDGRVVAMVPLVYETGTVGAQVVFERQGPLAKVVGFSIMPWTPPTDAQPSDATIAPRHFTPPPPYAKPNAFREVELRVQAPGGPELLAILAVPALASAESPVPGALLIPGDGAFDVDGTAGANKPLRDIAQGLAASGIATLRVERRAHATPEAFAKGTAYTAQEAIVDDAIAALALLREQEAVDASSISIIGHGLGGWLAPTLAAQDGNVQRLVLLAPHGVDLAASLARQARRLAQSLPEDATQARASLEEAAQLIPRAESGALDSAEGLLGNPGEYWRTLLSRRPAAALSAFKDPVLLVFAQGDHVVDEEDRESWTGLLADGNMLSQSRDYEDVNHFLVPTTETGPEALSTRGNVSEPVVRDIASFLLAGRMP